MINNREEYLYYLEQDRLALGIPDGIMRPRFSRDYVWRFERLMRKLEFWTNCKNEGLGKIYTLLLKYRYQKMSMKLGFSIPINCFAEGLYISHYGTIVVNSRAKKKKNCRIQEGINIGDSRGGVPTIGDNVYICSGAKVVGDIYIADDVMIGAQSFVNKSIDIPGVTVAGIPARIIGEHSSRPYLNKRLFNNK